MLSASAFGLLSRPAGAQAPSTASPEAEDASPTIVLLFDPNQPDASRLISAIESHLVGLPVRVALEPSPHGEILTWLESGHARARARRALGVLAIDTSRAADWRLFFLDVEGAPTLLRRLRSSPEHAPLDEAGVAVRLLVEALLDSRQLPEGESLPPEDSSSDVGPSATNATSGQPANSPKSDANSGSAESDASDLSSEVEPAAETASALGRAGEWPIVVSVGPAGTTWLEKQPLQFGGTATVALSWTPTWSVAVAYTWYPRQTYRLAFTDLALSRHPAMSYVAFTPRAGLSPRFWLGLATDAVVRKTLGTRDGYRATDRATTWSWAAVAGVGMVTPLSASFSAIFDLGLQVTPAKIEFVNQTDSRDLLIATRTVSPFFNICLGLRL